MTELYDISNRVVPIRHEGAAHAGTAGEIFEGPGGPLGSFSRNVFSSPIIRLVVMVYVWGELAESWCVSVVLDALDQIQQCNGRGPCPNANRPCKARRGNPSSNFFGHGRHSPFSFITAPPPCLRPCQQLSTSVCRPEAPIVLHLRLCLRPVKPPTANPVSPRPKTCKHALTTQCIGTIP
jgi:hypothetical protein